MITVSVQIQNLDAVRRAFTEAPANVLNYLSKAVVASLFEVEKQAVDPNFQFKTPRSRRTGYLQRSFDFGRHIDSGGLRGSIGPTALYAPYVYFGTRRGIKPNPYMDRIAKKAEPNIQRHFETAVGFIVSDLAV